MSHDLILWLCQFCALAGGAIAPSPGHLWFLPQGQQDGLSIDEDGPAGQAEQQYNQRAPLEDLTHSLQVLTAKGLNNNNKVKVQKGKHILTVHTCCACVLYRQTDWQVLYKVMHTYVADMRVSSYNAL